MMRTGGRSRRATRILWLTAAVLLHLGLHTPSGTAAVAPVTVDELARKADQIVRGRVASVVSWWDSTHSYIFTTAEIGIAETYKGDIIPLSTVPVVTPGGEVGTIGFGVEHAAHFTVGEDVILFLTPIDSGRFRVTRWEQGKYTVKNGRIVETHMPVAGLISAIRDALR